MKKLKNLCKHPGCIRPVTVQCICGDIRFCSHHGMEDAMKRNPEIIKKYKEIINEKTKKLNTEGKGTVKG